METKQTAAQLIISNLRAAGCALPVTEMETIMERNGISMEQFDEDLDFLISYGVVREFAGVTRNFLELGEGC